MLSLLIYNFRITKDDNEPLSSVTINNNNNINLKTIGNNNIKKKKKQLRRRRLTKNKLLAHLKEY